MKKNGKNSTKRTRKPKKRSLRTKADTLFSKYIRGRDKKCQRCGKTTQLQAAHIYSRSILSTRYDYDNALTLCAGCHLYWAHKNPIDFTEFVREYLGEERYNSLKERAHCPEQMTIEKYETIINDLIGRLNDNHD